MPGGQQDAVALGRPAPDPAAQLVQLGQTEPLRVLDHHDGGVGHVDAHLDDRRGHQHLHLAVAEPPHDTVALVGLEPPVHQRRPTVGPPRGEHSRHGRRGPQVAPVSDSSMTGKHDVRLPRRAAHSAATKSKTRSRWVPRRTAVRTAPRPGGRSRSTETIEIAIQRERQRSGDRRGR